MLLTVELNKKDENVEIFCDTEGLELLIQKLNMLKKNGGHDHLMTPAWAGNELTEEKQRTKNKLINHLCIMLKPKKDQGVRS